MSLKEILGEELYNQVIEKLGDKKVDIVNDGRWIPKEKFDAVNTEKQEYKNMLNERDTQLEDLKKKARDSEELSKEIKELQKKNEETVEEYEQRLKEQSFNFQVEKAISEAQAKNVKAVKALIDLEKVKQEDGSLIGLSEQLEQLKKDEPYLFGAELKGRKPHEDPTPPPKEDNPWKPETFNLTKQGQIMREDPDKAEKLKQQAGVK